MCFYYAIAKKNPKSLIDRGIIKEKQLDLFADHFLVNGFEHPAMPIITDANPNEISFFRWGFVPNTVKTETEAASILKQYNTLNAHGSRVFESKLYGDAIRNRRCLVLCSGFFEWRKFKGKKIPYYISLTDDSLFVFAGIWSSWVDEKGTVNGTFSVITVEANEMLAQIHNTKKRMPLILNPEQAHKWIDPILKETELRSMLVPIEDKYIKAHTVKQFLNKLPSELQNSDIIAYYNYPGVTEIMVEKWGRNENCPGNQLTLDF